MVHETLMAVFIYAYKTDYFRKNPTKDFSSARKLRASLYNVGKTL